MTTPDILVIDNTAYYTNVKFESRYLMNDSTMLGVLFDAGKVFVNHFCPGNLRTAIGLSLKF